ncbi:MAG: cytochrome c oxidase subunit 3 [Phycisphaerales bacterium]|nr:cytochrome c oxidase subunit 3 [Phycisphaerales bacterium]
MPQIESPFQDPASRFAAGKMGMVILLISLGMLFAAALLGYVVVRLDDVEAWPPPGMPGLSSLLWLSTLAIVVSSGSMWMATRAAERGDVRRVRTWTLLTLILGMLFLFLQTTAWLEMARDHADFGKHLYAWSFYFLTALHAAHLVGGVIPLAVVTYRAHHGLYSRENHRGVTYAAMYWHFLDGAWVVIRWLIPGGLTRARPPAITRPRCQRGIDTGRSIGR